MANRLQKENWQSMITTGNIPHSERLRYECNKCHKQFIFVKQLREHFREDHAY